MERASLRKYVPLHEVDWRIPAALIALNTICLFAYRQLDFVAAGLQRLPLLTLAEETIGGLAGLLVSPLIYLTAIRFPLISAKWRWNLLIHLLAVCVISLLHTTAIALLRLALFPMLGLAAESYGYLPMRYPMEFSHLFIYYWFGVCLIYFFHEVRFAREREVHQAKLESNLAEAQLQNLRLQLEPHFLFNALNAISAAIYENPRAADEMIGRLGELLRQLLKDDPSQLVPLYREIEVLQLYTSIMEARLEDRLSVTIETDESVRQALVPQLILQPLVENAIRHGMNSGFHVDIVIQSTRDGDALVLSVRDRGPGIDERKPLVFGVGLRNTTERLQRLYGVHQSLGIRNAHGGGAIIEVRLPFHAANVTEETDSPAFEAIQAPS